MIDSNSKIKIMNVCNLSLKKTIILAKFLTYTSVFFHLFCIIIFFCEFKVLVN